MLPLWDSQNGLAVQRVFSLPLRLHRLVLHLVSTTPLHLGIVLGNLPSLFFKGKQIQYVKEAVGPDESSAVASVFQTGNRDGNGKAGRKSIKNTGPKYVGQN